jgi:predicted DNA binding protein
MLRISAQFRHNCPFSRIAQRYPHVRMSHWFNFNTEYLELVGASAPEIVDIRRRLSKLCRTGRDVKILGLDAPGTVGFAFRSRKSVAPIVDKILDRNCALLLPPVVYRDGWEHYHLLLIDDACGEGLVREMKRNGELRVTRVAADHSSVGLESSCIPLQEFVKKLTPRQAGALRLAYSNGYYLLPRKTALRPLAKEFGVSRSTYEEHVRKAERNVIRVVVPHLDDQAG